MLAVLALVLPGNAFAQECDGKIISAIAIVPRDPSFLRFPRVLRPLARGVGLVHTTTKAEVIRHFLLFNVGQPCTERQRSESERILRFQPFLADATVRAVSDGAGGVRIEVETLDEIPTVFDIRFRDGGPVALRVGNGNVGGRGVYLALRGERGFAYRTGAGVELVAHQTFGRPYSLVVVAARAPLGSTVSVAFGHAFITDLQRTAWHVGFRDVRAYTVFARPGGVPLAFGARRRFADFGGVQRIGFGGHSAFVGGLVTAERVVPAAGVVVISDSGLVADTSAALGGPPPVAPVDNLRVNAVVGVRSVTFMAVRGFDALLATQDVATGVQVGAMVGRGIRLFGARDADVFLAADVHAGLGSPTSFFALEAEGEARRDLATHYWDAMVASGRVAWYGKPVPAFLVIASTEFSGGWRGRFPFQLRLGDRQGGVRGYHGSLVGGAVRGVARLETRWAIGPLSRHVAVGVASFADAGRVWAGDAPFGIDSRVNIGVGMGLLAAIPPQSRRLWRLDIAIPVSPDAHAGWEIRLTAVRASGFWREPSDVARTRAGAAPGTIFTWP